MEQLSPQELELLRLLQQNSRFDIGELIEKLNMSRTSVYERIKKLEQEGYIKNYVALLDARKLGLKFMVIVHVSLNTQRIEYTDEFLEKVQHLDEIVDVYVTGGIVDVILKVLVKDPDDFNEFVMKKLSVLPHISKIQSSFVMRTIKQTTNLPI
ncbi:AsnC family transcriptional regulator [Chitinophaga skermanii]|uniref:AsnC family transcriptional regulator n=1 Tax=Chitinophaga skermanii TaxID=331697 RepID=A0A327R2X4_9BACT|nr:Lrp/AsnC family transcriptional regulator [Chitinophaga skermanii]RAJ08237.1 AsnC family transcriptional regulator [Chitinophaga skermanii]